ncbi:MAG: zinc-binding dehydrogenase [Bacteroidota bacterium]
MNAIVLRRFGPPSGLTLEPDYPKPEPREGDVLIRAEAFGLNRSEMYTRQGHPGNAVQLPRVLGIECVGTVEAAPNTDLAPGKTVAAFMGGLGRAYDGGYAEYTRVPRAHVIPLTTTLDWRTLAALPETFATAWGSLAMSLRIEHGQTLLVRGGTSSVGMAAISIAKDLGLTVLATTRREARRQVLLDQGADEVLIDNGSIAEATRHLLRDRVDAVLELVGTATLADSLRCVRPGGIVCYTGILGNEWVLHTMEAFQLIPSTVRLTTFTSDTVPASELTDALQRIVELVETGRYRPAIHRVFAMNEITEAHAIMERGGATGKLVVDTRL